MVNRPPKTKIPWTRILAESAAIVASILLAFAIDAWWQERKEAQLKHTQLESLLSEFTEAKDRLETQLRYLHNSLGATVEILERMGPEPTEEDVVAVATTMRVSFNIGIMTPPQAVLDEVLSNRSVTEYANQKLYKNLQAWPGWMLDIENDGVLLDANRENDYMRALFELGIPMSYLLQAGGYPGMPASELEADLSALLRDPAMDTVFSMRTIRLRTLIGAHEESIRIAGEITADLESMLQ